MLGNGRNVMRSVKVNKIDLLKTVQENLEKHIAEYNESVEDYKSAVIKVAEKNLELAKTRDLDQIAKHRGFPSAPRSHEAEYNRAIRMLQMSVDIDIELEETIFNQLVLDEWAWKDNFAMMASTYKSF